jgi:diguanylate cyclase (GGDEF)-like protein
MGDRHRAPLQHKLRALFESARLPSSPAVARLILRLIEDPDSSARDFAAVIEADPAMAARLVRLANAAHYAQRNPVCTIQRAVTVIGLAQLRVVALGFELVGHLDRLGGCRFDLRRFWRDSALRACLARQVALRVVPQRAEEAFLVGLLLDCGIVTLVQGLGPDYAELYRACGATPAEFHQAERKKFPYTHVEAVESLAALWHFPQVLAHALARHHRRAPAGGRASDETRLCAVAHFAGSLGLAEGEVAATLPAAESPILRQARQDLGLDEEAWRACLDDTADSFARMAPMLEEEEEPGDVADLLVLANRHLQAQAARRDEALRALEAERDRAVDEQVTLRRALGDYRDQAARDPLTGLLNRRALLDALRAWVGGAEGTGGMGGAAGAPAAPGASMAVLFLDVDDFKAVNDTFGHDAGDDVLRAVASVLVRACTADGDAAAFAGRYGGEEFVLALPGEGPANASRRCHALLEEIRSLRFQRRDRPPRVTASLGAACCALDAGVSAEALIAAADELMYRAKRGGKDRFCVAALAPDDLSRFVGHGAGGAGESAAA